MIAENFSKCAYLYDAGANIQRKAAEELIKQIKGESFSAILEIGCGTGSYTVLLRNKFKDARIQAMDISAEMVEIAQNKLKDKNVEFVLQDARALDAREKFDLITSNAALHWFSDLEKVLLSYKKMLEEDGVIAFSLFGPKTFGELNDILSGLFDKNISAADFMDQDGLKRMLQKSFSDVLIGEVQYKEAFSCLKELLYKIKNTGVRGRGIARKSLFSPKIISKIESFYLQKFHQIKATYQVFFCCVKV